MLPSLSSARSVITRLPVAPLWPVFRQWPLDKQLTLLLPLTVLITALLFGDIRQWQPQENKAALFSMGLFVVLILLARYAIGRGWCSERGEWLLREFWPVPALLLGYLTMRVLRLELAVDALGNSLRDDWMLAFDTALFGNALPVLLEPLIHPALTAWMETAYLHCYYALPIGSLLWLFWQNERALFLRLRLAILLTLCGGFLMYFLIPVRGPMDAMPHLFSVSLGEQNAVVYDAVNSFRYAYDCFPSLHTAIPWVVLLVCWARYGTPLKTLALLFTLSITASTLYLRYHYGADVLAGVLWAVLVWRWVSVPARA